MLPSTSTSLARVPQNAYALLHDVFPVGNRPAGGSGHAKEDPAGDATLPRSRQSRVRDADAAVPANFRKYFVEDCV